MWTRTMIGALAALVLSGTVVAAEPYVGIGATRLSDLDSTGFRLHGGLRFDDDWSLEATVHRFNADGSPHGSHDLSTDVWSVGARYEFGDDAFVPFAKIGVARMTTDTLSKMPVRNSITHDTTIHRERPKPMVASPKPATVNSNTWPGFFHGGNLVCSTAIAIAPSAGAARNQPSPTGPTKSTSLA